MRFSSLLEWPRHKDPLTSAWLAVNAIREWRGDTHWAIMISEDIDGVMAGILTVPDMTMTTIGFHEVEELMMLQLLLH